jgi:hypothetical protein
MIAAWKIDGRVLTLVEATGEIRVPCVDEIYSALIEKVSAASGLATEVEGLRASRYPLVPVLVVGESEGNGLPSYSLSGLCRGKEVSLQEDDLTRGHIPARGALQPCRTLTLWLPRMTMWSATIAC